MVKCCLYLLVCVIVHVCLFVNVCWNFVLFFTDATFVHRIYSSVILAIVFACYCSYVRDGVCISVSQCIISQASLYLHASVCAVIFECTFACMFLYAYLLVHYSLSLYHSR